MIGNGITFCFKISNPDSWPCFCTVFFSERHVACCGTVGPLRLGVDLMIGGGALSFIVDAFEQFLTVGVINVDWIEWFDWIEWLD